MFYCTVSTLLEPEYRGTNYLLLYILGVYRSTLNLLEPGYRDRDDLPTPLYSRSIWEYIKPIGTRIQKDDLPTPLEYRSTLNLLEPGHRRTNYLLLYTLGVYGSTLNLLEPRYRKTTYLLLYILGVCIWKYIKPSGTWYRKTTYLLLYILGVYGSTLNLLEPDTERRPTYSSIF